MSLTKYLKIKRIIYNILKYPIILLFIKTPLINILKERFRNHRSYIGKNIFWFILDSIFQREYLSKINNRKEYRSLIEPVLSNGEGAKWAGHYLKNKITIDNLKNEKIGNIALNEAKPIYEKLIKFIDLNKISDDFNTYIIQLGSSSGREIEFFLNLFPKLNYVSTDITDEILDFQKQIYNYKNLKYYKCYAEDINECINYYKLEKKNIILFSSSTLQYLNNFFINEFFKNIKIYNKVNLFLIEPVDYNFIKSDSKDFSYNRGNDSFSHKYDKLAEKQNLVIKEKKIINTGISTFFYLHVSN